MVTYSAKQILELYAETTINSFDGGAAQIFELISQPPEQLPGKSVILTSVNSVYVKSKRPDSKFKSFRDTKSKSTRNQGNDDPEGWTEVAKIPHKAGLSSRGTSRLDETGIDKSATSGSIPVSSNRFGDLLLDSSDSFFQDEASQESHARNSEADGSKMVKLLELRRSGPESATPTGLQPIASDLSLNAPSFTPLAKDKTSSDSNRVSESIHSESRINWVYLDPNGSKQGPFSSSQMSSWFSAGYFPSNLPVAWFPVGRPMDASLQFYPLDLVYVGRTPFAGEPISPARSSENSLTTKLDDSIKTAAPRVATQRGWLWSPGEDAKLSEASSSKTGAPSLAAIMALEANKERTNK